MKLKHSNSVRRESPLTKSNKQLDDSTSPPKMKRSNSFKFDPTTQVSHPFPDLIWKMTFYKLPEAPQLNPASLSSNQVMDLLHGCLLSNAVYKSKRKRRLPANLSNIVFECDKSDYYRVPYFIVDSDELDTIFIAFRGSACAKDWHVDFLAAAIEYENGHVHEGVYFTALNIFNDIKEKVREISMSHNKRKIIATGHSLGGAVAGMISILFNEEMIDLNVRAVCLAPVASLSKEVWDFSHEYIQSYINYGDLVPFISYYNTYHLPENSLPKLTHENLKHWCVKKINKHSKRPEFALMIQRFTKPILEPFKLVPPGVSYIIQIDKKESRVELQNVDDQQLYFGQFLKNLSAMNHPIKLYKHSIIRFLCEYFNQDQKLISYYDLAKMNRHHRIIHSHKNAENNDNDNDDENILIDNNDSDTSESSPTDSVYSSSSLETINAPKEN